MSISRESRPAAQHLAASGLWLGAAKIMFLVAGYATSLVLSRLVEPATFGNYGVLARLVAIPNMVIVQSLSFAVSRPLAGEYVQGMPSYHRLRSRGFRMAAGLGGLFGAALLTGATAIGEQLQDLSLARPLQLLAPISVLYALYAVNIGTLNAGRAFFRQAGLDIFMSSAKAALIIAAAALGLGLEGLSAAFTIASGCALFLSIGLVRAVKPTPRGEVSLPPALGTLVLALLATTAASQILLSTDILLLKSNAFDEVQRASVGFYTGAQMIALVPYSLLNAVNLLIFPLVASLDVSDPQQSETRRRYISRTIEVMLILVGGLGAVLSGGAQQVTSVIFPASYSQAAQDLQLLAFGYGGYAIGLNAVWILNSASKAGHALILVLAILAAAAGCQMWLIPEQGHAGAALGVLISGAIAATLGLVALGQIFGARASWLALVKIAAAAALTTYCGQMLAHYDFVTGAWARRLVSLAELAGLGVLFLGLLAATRAISRDLLNEVRGKKA